jgi:hypothetical protein
VSKLHQTGLTAASASSTLSRHIPQNKIGDHPVGSAGFARDSPCDNLPIGQRNFEMDKYLDSEPRKDSDTTPIDQVASAGQAIVRLLHKAADASEAKTRQTVEAAQGLSNRLLAAKERINGLESDLQSFREKAARAEGWLEKISSEIEDRLIPRGDRSPEH